MHKMEESVPENAPLIPVILLKDTQVWVKASGKMTELHAAVRNCFLVSGPIFRNETKNPCALTFQKRQT